MKKPNILMILDGYGIYKDYEYNAVKNANTPFLDHLFATYPNCQLKTCGVDVGLPEGIMGNSEVGHLNIGAGRIVYQELLRINKAMKQGEFSENPMLLRGFDICKQKQGRIHFMGLLSDAGVHSNMDHLTALVQVCKEKNLKDVFIHCFMDGRDTPPTSGISYVRKLSNQLKEMGLGKIASLSGRFYAMDRDNRWERVEKAYKTITGGTDCNMSDLSPEKEMDKQYQEGQTDEFILPVCFGEEGRIKDNDLIIFFNFRADRAREITRAFFENDFDVFERKKINYADYICMVPYKEEFPLPALFSKDVLKSVLGEVIAQNGLRQLRIAETEKYAHVTFFLNGAEERPFKDEDRILIPSPRSVATYDQKPEMSAFEVTEKLLANIEEDIYDVLIVNYANCDMVGHTGIYEAALKAVEAVDKCVKKVVEKVLEKKGQVLLCADHGNSDQLRDDEGRPHTAHTFNPVPCICISPDFLGKKMKDGILADIMPTFLDMIGLPSPSKVTGKTLINS